MKENEEPYTGIDVQHLQYFAVVAKESSVRKAAERLFMAQPPLSRHIKRLEERLGTLLFVRHSKGLTLTKEGEHVLKIIQPLLEMKEKTFSQLFNEIKSEKKVIRLGLTTAVEQGFFTKLESILHSQYEKSIHITRSASPKLIGDMRKGRLDIAFVALPLDAPGFVIKESTLQDPFVAAVPESWNFLPHQPISISQLNGQQLFWFKREANPAFFDFTKIRFSYANFTPCFIEEPKEHDVLLARIAAGEGMGLFPSSFAAIKREGVTFLPLAEESLLYLQLGLAFLQKDISNLSGIIDTLEGLLQKI